MIAITSAQSHVAVGGITSYMCRVNLIVSSATQSEATSMHVVHAMPPDAKAQMC